MAPHSFLHTIYPFRVDGSDVEGGPASHVGICNRFDMVGAIDLPRSMDTNKFRGIAATLQAAAFNWQGMMVCRFFMAMAEAGYGPGLPYLLSFFYMRHELGLRCGIFLSAAPFATCFAGALAYGITSGHSALTNWKLLFLVEGLPSIVLAFIAWFFLPDSPEKARFLDTSEKEVARARAIRQVGQEGASRVGGISFKEVGAALLDVKNWLTAVSRPTPSSQVL
jgi:MFS family permease